MAKKTYSIILNVEVTEDKQPGRMEYYYLFKGWKYGVISEENAISFEGKNIGEAYSRWSTDELLELGKVIRNAAVEMVRKGK